jgi:hypothetical protein
VISWSRVRTESVVEDGAGQLVHSYGVEHMGDQHALTALERELCVGPENDRNVIRRNGCRNTWPYKSGHHHTGHLTSAKRAAI